MKNCIYNYIKSVKIMARLGRDGSKTEHKFKPAQCECGAGFLDIRHIYFKYTVHVYLFIYL